MKGFTEHKDAGDISNQTIETLAQIISIKDMSLTEAMKPVWGSPLLKLDEDAGLSLYLGEHNDLDQILIEAIQGTEPTLDTTPEEFREYLSEFDGATLSVLKPYIESIDADLAEEIETPDESSDVIEESTQFITDNLTLLISEDNQLKHAQMLLVS